MEFRQAKRLDPFKTGIFAALDLKKAEMIRAGRTVYNLSVGTPDMRPPRAHFGCAYRFRAGAGELEILAGGSARASRCGQRVL